MVCSHKNAPITIMSPMSIIGFGFSHPIMILINEMHDNTTKMRKSGSGINDFLGSIGMPNEKF
ncbi:hypothetical protein DWR03_05345 [Salmonella enterica]|nr:hypothetical protein AW50_48785 [Salmonella enterica subsp. enterica serovar Anatum str. USDA-ARS-USMARC-1735]EAA5445857.1 hypothetical protein [Salmonella enterica subsp. enterica serovar Weltevreden]EAA5680430.1 hypothetical protein [Salmonella enterica subsp. enterica]EAA5984241.1 hypothetical protein [Salmonella enterica subsp. enterica serovar Anatum]EAB3873789.1 hypothetical protein [Salmonella enterica]EAO0022583.1 hypothetical protein [Salmonella enterica subsp. enterica serovar Ams